MAAGIGSNSRTSTRCTSRRCGDRRCWRANSLCNDEGQPETIPSEDPIIVARWKGDEWTLTEHEIAEWFNKAARDERLRLTQQAIALERQLDGMYESEADFDFGRAEELNDRIIELSVQADELRRARRRGC